MTRPAREKSSPEPSVAPQDRPRKKAPAKKGSTKAGPSSTATGLARRLAPRAAVATLAALGATGCAMWGSSGPAPSQANAPTPPARPSLAAAPSAATPAAPPALTPELSREIDAAIAGRFAECWTNKTASPTGYVPAVRLSFKPDGGFAAPPRLANSPSDPEEKALAQAALAAAKRCAFKAPVHFAPHHAAWRTRVVRFGPSGA